MCCTGQKLSLLLRLWLRSCVKFRPYCKTSDIHIKITTMEENNIITAFKLFVITRIRLYKRHKKNKITLIKRFNILIPLCRFFILDIQLPYVVKPGLLIFYHMANHDFALKSDIMTYRRRSFDHAHCYSTTV